MNAPLRPTSPEENQMNHQRITLLRIAGLISAVLASSSASAAVQQAAPQNRIVAVEVSPDGPAGAKGARVVIKGTTRPAFSVFKLTEPERVVVDLASADVSQANPPLDVHQGGIAGVTAAQFDEGGTKVGRIVVALEQDARYDVTADGDDLIVTVAPHAVDLPAAPAKDAQASAATVVDADPSLVATLVMDKESATPAKTLRAMAVQGTAARTTVKLSTDGEIGRLTLIELQHPGRLALDLGGVTALVKSAKGAGAVKSVRAAKHEDGVRVVVDAAGDRFPQYEIDRSKDGLSVRIGAPAVAAKVTVPLGPAVEARTARAPAPEVAPAAEAALVAPGANLPVVRAVELRNDEGITRVTVSVEKPVQFEVYRPNATTAVLTLHGAVLPERLERNLDPSALGGPLSLLSTYRTPGAPNEIRVVATLREPAPDDLQAQRGTLTWKFGAAATVGPIAIAAAPAPRAGAAASEAKAAGNVFDDRNYTGRRVDFNVKDMDIKNLLSAFAEIGKKNIIVADDVQGKVTIKLRNVPWDQALDIVLKSKALGREETGNILRVAPIERLRAEQKEAADAAKIKTSLEPLKVRLIPVNYAKATELQERLKDALSDRGTVSVDVRTNTLIVKDVQEALIRAEGIVRNLDTQTPEVLIESRIVEASTQFSRAAGIQWGGNVSLAPAFGNPTGLVFPNIVNVAGAADDGQAPLSGLNGLYTPGPNFAVNMPTPIGVNNGAGVGFVFGSAGGAANLALRLSAAENTGVLKTISSPRVVTVDNIEASIGQGVAIPFSQVSASGVSTSFIEAKLELRVQPHVTQEGSVQMRINVSNNQPNPGLTGANGQPSITRREARTEVLVKDGDTTVIGGIYTRVNGESWNEVPILSKIPVLGWLFKHKSISDGRTELLVFITPRIVNRSQSVVAAAPDTGSQQ